MKTKRFRYRLSLPGMWVIYIEINPQKTTWSDLLMECQRQGKIKLDINSSNKRCEYKSCHFFFRNKLCIFDELVSKYSDEDDEDITNVERLLNEFDETERELIGQYQEENYSSQTSEQGSQTETTEGRNIVVIRRNRDR